ncbi:MAG: MoaD/ThiS family protein [Dongiaceae bacterium]
MARVVLPGSMKAAAGGRTEFEIEAANAQQLLARLGRDHPKLKPLLDRGVSISIDNQLYREPAFQPITATSEVFILPRMAGG